MSAPIEATEVPVDRLYTRSFFQVFAAVVLFMTGVALQFHFGQYVDYLGHGVDTLGRILSISMVGTLLIRLRIGRWIDRFGYRPVWLVGTLLVAVTMGSIQFTTSLWLITVLRAGSIMAMAAVMTTVAVFAALIAPPRRRAESMGTIGLAGFLGMMIGPTLGDWIFSGTTESILPYHLFFSASAVCSALAGGAMVFIKLPPDMHPLGDDESQHPHGSPRSISTVSTHDRLDGSLVPPSQMRVIARYWPGTILLIGVIFSMAFCWQSLFLERLAEARGFRDIKLFFMIYGPTAIVLRIVFRRLPEQIGRTRVVILGLVLLAIGQLAMVGIRSQWELVLPGFLMGAGHCFIFPSMVDLGAERFPLAYRGTGTSLILGAGDVGMLLGFVGLGEVIDVYGFDKALILLASLVLTGMCILAIARRDAVFFRNKPRFR